MLTETIAMKKGDVFRWAYRDRLDTGTWGTYHCCSRIAIVDANGRLRDTYWLGGQGRSFGADDHAKLDLTFLANTADLKRSHEYEADYYDSADIVDLNHANSSRGNFYLRIGAKRSAAKMLESARHKLEKAESDARMATRRADDLRAAITKIETGDIADIYL